MVYDRVLNWIFWTHFFQRSSMYYSVYTVTYATTNLEGELSIYSAAVTEICERDVL